MIEKPWSAACERNREPILAVLRTVFADRRRVLEIGSGTGQHAVHFAAGMPWLVWQTADRAPYLPGIRAWLDEAGLANTPEPLRLDVNDTWPVASVFDAAFTANTLHIMSEPEVARMFKHLPAVLAEDARLVIYGPFRINDAHTSASNAAFDASLREGGSAMGIRDLEVVTEQAAAAGFALVEDRAMPANNRCLIFKRCGAARA